MIMFSVGSLRRISVISAGNAGDNVCPGDRQSVGHNWRRQKCAVVKITTICGTQPFAGRQCRWVNICDEPLRFCDDPEERGKMVDEGWLGTFCCVAGGRRRWHFTLPRASNPPKSDRNRQNVPCRRLFSSQLQKHQQLGLGEYFIHYEEDADTDESATNLDAPNLLKRRRKVSAFRHGHKFSVASAFPPPSQILSQRRTPLNLDVLVQINELSLNKEHQVEMI